MTLVLRLMGRARPCSLRNRPHALQSTCPASSRRQSGVVEVWQFWHTGVSENWPRPLSLSLDGAIGASDDPALGAVEELAPVGVTDAELGVAESLLASPAVSDVSFFGSFLMSLLVLVLTLAVAPFVPPEGEGHVEALVEGGGLVVGLEGAPGAEGAAADPVVGGSAPPASPAVTPGAPACASSPSTLTWGSGPAPTTTGVKPIVAADIIFLHVGRSIQILRCPSRLWGFCVSR